MERPVELDRWIDLAARDGRKLIVLLDHLELYRKTPAQYEEWRAKGGFQARYPLGREGHRALFADFDRAAAGRKDLMIFKGWEVSEDELDSGSEMEALRAADVIGWHISPRNGSRPPDGQTLIRRARQIKELQEKLPVPMILLHPFPMRLENIRRTAARTGRDLNTIPVAEYRFFQPGEQDALIHLLRGSSISIEMNRDTEQYMEDPKCLEALLADIVPLVQAGLSFTIGSDNHHMRAAGKPFQPDETFRVFGLTERNTSPIVKELLNNLARPR
jgi:hypothetical protein